MTVWLGGYGSPLLTVLILQPGISICLDPQRSTCLACDLQQMLMWSKLSADSWCGFLLHQNTSFGAAVVQELECQWWLCGGLVCTMCYPVCHIYEVSIKFFTYECLLPHFWYLSDLYLYIFCTCFFWETVSCCCCTIIKAVDLWPVYFTLLIPKAANYIVHKENLIAYCWSLYH